MFLLTVCLLSLVKPVFSINQPASQAKNTTWHEANRLFQRLLDEKYCRVARPRYNQSQPVRVFAHVRLSEIVSIDIKTQLIKLQICVAFKWRDDFLNWENEMDLVRYGRHVRMDPTQLWTPDVGFIDSIQNFELLKETSIFPIRVNWRGTVTWQVGALVSTTCVMDTTFFPYDTQLCRLSLGTWQMNNSLLHLRHTNFGKYFEKKYRYLTAKHVEQHTEWELMCATQTATNVRHRLVEGNSTELHFNFVFKRRPKYYEYTVLYPMSLIAFMAIFAFTLPNGSGEKVTFSVTILLSLVFNLSSIGDFFPSNGDYFPIVGSVFLLWIFLVAISIIQSTFILWIYSAPENPAPVPDILRNFFMHKAMKLSSLSSEKRVVKRIERLHRSSQVMSDRLMRHSSNLRHDHVIKATATTSDSKPLRMNHNNDERTWQINKSADIGLVLANQMEASMCDLVAFIRTGDVRGAIRLEWQIVGNIVDRIVFAIYTVTVIGIAYYLIYSSISHAYYANPETDERCRQDDAIYQ
ncbi:neuronal acetylcholine receptor subunit alpha-6-like [Symsagittifera roscoffensis]|uniref:neuronal acetylcholine receptor subunit alpha-6-like n=1 Tax=Symsagittifera roscoffensis TaxID=84072 RepID=UPI00307CA547